MGRCQDPALLKGYGPIGAEQTRILAFAKHSKRRLLIVDDKGTPPGATANTHRPPAAIRKLIQLRRPTRSLPGCTIPAEHCDPDHRKTWAQGGRTGQRNLDPPCRRHHNPKTHAGRTSRLKDDGETLTWTTPTHHTHTSTPDPHPTGPPDDDDHNGRLRQTKEP